MSKSSRELTLAMRLKKYRASASHIKQSFYYYQYMLGDIYYWRPSGKALLIAGVAFFMNCLILSTQIFSYLFNVESLHLDLESLKFGIFSSLFNLFLLSLSVSISLFFRRKAFGQSFSLIFALFCLVISMALASMYIGYFDNVTWQVFFLFNASLIIFLDRRAVFISFFSLICLMVLLALYHDVFPFPIYAIGLSSQLQVIDTNTHRMWFEWLQLLWVAGVGILMLDVLLRLWRIREVDLRSKSYIDELTQLLNRRALLEGLGVEYRRANRVDYPISVAVLDIDFFKKVNDKYGHPFGDIVLQGIASNLKSLGRKNDLVGRYGGEEFLIVLPECNAKFATTIIDSLRAKIEELVFETQSGDKISITISAGIAQQEDVDDNHLQVIARADFALYRAKQSGRNQVLSIEIEDDEILAFLDSL